jgi:hypothetical protein
LTQASTLPNNNNVGQEEDVAAADAKLHLAKHEEPTFNDEMSSSSNDNDDDQDEDERWNLHSTSKDDDENMDQDISNQRNHSNVAHTILDDDGDDVLADDNVGIVHYLDIPQEIFHEICHYIHDPATLCHVSSTSKVLHQQLIQDVESSILFWKPLYEHRWIRSSSSSFTPSSLDWNIMFQQRFVVEGHVIRTIQHVVENELEPDKYDFQSLQQRSNGRIASTYIESPDWKRLIHDGDNSSNDESKSCQILDVLCAIANMEVDYHPMLQRLKQHEPSFRWPLIRFVAASAAFTFHCQEVVEHMNILWERALQQQLWNPSLITTEASQLLYEETAMVLAHALRPIPDLLHRSSSLQQCKLFVALRLDEIAHTVQNYMACLDGIHLNYGNASRQDDTRTLLQTIHFVLSTKYGIRYHYPIRRRILNATAANDGTMSGGATDDIAVHCCSIAHVLQCHHQHHVHGSQPKPLTNNWCHPVLVAIIYQAVARRLGLIGDILFCPQNCHAILRFTGLDTAATSATSSSEGQPCLLFLDLVEDPGNIMTLVQCKELVRRCDLMTEHTFQDRRRHMNLPWPNHILNNEDFDDEEDWREDADAFCFQTPMTVHNVVFWLVSPFLVSRQDEASSSSGDDSNDGQELDEDQPYDFLLGQLVEGNGGSLLSFLQDRLVFFSAIMRHCELIH